MKPGSTYKNVSNANAHRGSLLAPDRVTMAGEGGVTAEVGVLCGRLGEQLCRWGSGTRRQR